MQVLTRNYISNTYQVLHPVKKVSCAGHHYLAFQISDGQQTYLAHAWEGQYHGPTDLEHGQTVNITGKWGRFNDKILLRCRTIAPTQAQPLAWRKARMRVRAMLLAMPNGPIKAFVQEVFTDNDVLQRFMQIPASRHHHHSYPGGLFIHSVEAAWEVYCNRSLPEKDKMIATVAALVHDIAKVVTHDSAGKQTDMGRYVDHDALTLAVLGDSLSRLDRSDREVGLLLRHYLTWNPRKYAIPRSMGAAYVRVADMASVASNLR